MGLAARARIGVIDVQALSFLPQATASAAKAALNALGTPLVQEGTWLRHSDGFLAQVDWDCTALWPAVVLVLAMGVFGKARGQALRGLVPALCGAVVFITLVNQLRVIAVIWVGVHAPAAFVWVHEAASPFWLVGAGAGYLVVMLGRGEPRWQAARVQAAG